MKVHFKLYCSDDDMIPGRDEEAAHAETGVAHIFTVHHLNTNYLVRCHVITLCDMTPRITINNAIMSPNEKESSNSTSNIINIYTIIDGWRTTG